MTEVCKFEQTFINSVQFRHFLTFGICERDKFHSHEKSKTTMAVKWLRYKEEIMAPIRNLFVHVRNMFEATRVGCFCLYFNSHCLGFKTTISICNINAQHSKSSNRNKLVNWKRSILSLRSTANKVYVYLPCYDTFTRSQPVVAFHKNGKFWGYFRNYTL